MAFISSSKWLWRGIYICCTLALVYHIGNLLEGYINPTVTNTVVEEKDIEDMDFPLIFKICIKPGLNLSASEELGYSGSPYDYFAGKSKFNHTIFGWAGHSENSTILEDVKNIYSKISGPNIEKIVDYIGVNSDIKEWFVMPLERHVSRDRVNFPHNCFTLDITNSVELQGKGIRRLFIFFHDLQNYEVEIFVHGASLACYRDIKDHLFYFSGDPIKIARNTAPAHYQYMMKMQQTVYVEEDVTKNCREYPNDDFNSYR